LGLRPGPRWGSSQRSPRTPNWILESSISKEREGKGHEKGREQKRGKTVTEGIKEKGEGRGRKTKPPN